MIASVASVDFRASDSNQRSRIGRAAPVSSSAASEAAASPSRPNERPSPSQRRRSPGPGRSRSGGVMAMVGSTSAATRSSIASYSG